MAQLAVSRAEAELARRTTEAAAAKQAAIDAEQEAKGTLQAERFRRFVAERLTEGEYLRHLGLIHTIRGRLAAAPENPFRRQPTDAAKTCWREIQGRGRGSRWRGSRHRIQPKAGRAHRPLYRRP